MKNKNKRVAKRTRCGPCKRPVVMDDNLKMFV